MKYLVRREYVTTGYEYSMPLTKEILQSLQEYMNEHVEPKFVVTEEMAIAAFTYSYNMLDDKEVLNTECNYKYTVSYHPTLGDVIADYLLDLIWEEDPEEIYCETDETHNTVNDSKDFD